MHRRRGFRESRVGELDPKDIPILLATWSAQPDVIVSYGMPMTARLKAATSAIPIVAFTGDPIRFGLISSLAHPGCNITGVSADAGIEIWAKRLELLSEAVPRLVNVAFVSTQGGWDGAGGRFYTTKIGRFGAWAVDLPLDYRSA